MSEQTNWASYSWPPPLRSAVEGGEVRAQTLQMSAVLTVSTDGVEAKPPREAREERTATASVVIASHAPASPVEPCHAEPTGRVRGLRERLNERRAAAERTGAE